MKNGLMSIVMACGIAATPLSALATGFVKVTVPDAGATALDVGIWYPSNHRAPAEPNTEFGLAHALDAPVADTNGGLIVLSHGYSGWYAGHADTAVALADAGFIVAAPSHAGNTWSDMSSAPAQWLIDRPRQISRVIDHVLTDKQFSPHVSAHKIGVYGFSAGGYTAIGLIGGIPDLIAASAHCKKFPREFACEEGLIAAMTDADMQRLPAASWGTDPRVAAASIAAPGFAFAYTAESLQDIDVEVQLWSGQLDTAVPTATNAALLAERMPKRPETHWVEQANHFAFLVMPCREAFKQEDPQEYEMVCSDADGFDRRAFHDVMHNEMVRFFKTALAID